MLRQSVCSVASDLAQCELLYWISVSVVFRVASHTGNDAPGSLFVVAPSFVRWAPIGEVKCDDGSDGEGCSIALRASVSLLSRVASFAGIALLTGFASLSAQGFPPLRSLKFLLGHAAQSTDQAPF